MYHSWKYLQSILCFSFLSASVSLAAATFGVTNTNDSGAGSLRQAILDANAASSHNNNILFTVGGTISLASSLPYLSSNIASINTDSNVVIIAGGNLYQGLFVAPNSSIAIANNLQLFQTASVGGNGGGAGGGGGGAVGAGGGIFVGPNATVLLTGVTFNQCLGKGGVGGSQTGSAGGGGGGGMNGGNGGDAFNIGGGGGAGYGGDGGNSVRNGGAGGGGFFSGGNDGPDVSGGGGGSDANPGQVGGGGGGPGGNGGADLAGNPGGAGGLSGNPGGNGIGNSGGGGAGGEGGSDVAPSGGNSAMGAGGGGGASFDISGGPGGSSTGSFGGGGGGGGNVGEDDIGAGGGNGGAGGLFGGGGGGGYGFFGGGLGGAGMYGGAGASGRGATGGGSSLFGGAGGGGGLSTFGGIGGTSSSMNGGGGGAGLGGAVFVAKGGFLSLANASSPFTGNTVQGGAGGTGSSPNGNGSTGQHLGTDIFVMSGGTLSFTPSGTVTISSNIESDKAAGGGTGGGLINNGPGTLVLSGINNYTGSTTLIGGITYVTQDANLGWRGVTFPVQATLAFNGGTLEVGGSFTSTRNTSISSSSGTIQVDPNFTFTLNGTITGNGPLTKLGSGTLVLGGDNTYSGLTTIAAGTLGITNSSSLGSGAVSLRATLELLPNFTAVLTNPINVPSAGTIQVDSDATLAYLGTISGSGNLNKTGPGTLVFFSTVTDSCPTFINQGEMILFGGAINNTVTINPGASLLGSGSVGTLTNNGGTVHPIGTLNVNGDYVQQNGATFSVGILDTGTNVQVEGLMSISGNAYLAGGGLVMASPTGAIPVGKQFLVLQTLQVGGIKSLFSSVSLPPGFDLTYANDPDQVVIMAMQQMFFFSSTPHHHNPTQVFNYFEAIQNNADPALLPIVDALADMNSSELTQALDQLHPAIFGAFDLLNANTSSMVTSIFNRRMGRICCEQVKRTCGYEGVKVWLDPLGYWYDQERIGEQVGFHATTAGAIAGLDYSFSNGVRVGGGGGYTWSDVKWRKQRGHGHMDAGYFGFFSDYTKGMIQVEAAVSGSVDSLEATRHIQFTTVNYKAHHNKGGYNFTAHVGGGADIKLAEYSVRPFATVDYLLLFQKGFREHGAHALNLVVQGRHAQMLRSEVGISGSLSFKVGKCGCLVPTIWVSGIAENFLNKQHYHGRFVNEPGEFAVRTYNKPIYLVSPGFDVSCILDTGLNLAVRYSAEITGQSTNHKLDGRVGWKF